MNTWDDGFTQGYRDASDSKDKQESPHPWDHPYSQGYSYGYSCGNYRRIYGHDPIQTIVD